MYDAVNSAGVMSPSDEWERTKIVLIHVFSTQNFGFQQARKTFHIEKLITESRVEVLAKAVLPGRPQFDKERLESVAYDPILHRTRDEFWASSTALPPAKASSAARSFLMISPGVCSFLFMRVDGAHAPEFS
jgi:hypothetical protein